MSPRPRIRRRVRGRPNSSYFKPAGVPLKNLGESTLTMPEFEALRLIDSLETTQEEAARKMEVSQPTLSRILKSARKKLSTAIVEGSAIKIAETSSDQIFKK